MRLRFAASLTHQRVILLKTSHQASDQEKPAVGEYEQNDFKWQGNEHGREHHHAHRHQRAGYDHVDDEEGNVDEEANLECDAEFAEHERGHEHAQGNVLAGARALHAGNVDEQRDVAGMRLAEHEFTDRLQSGVERFLLGQLTGNIGLHRVVVHALIRRPHDVGREKQRETHKNLIGRRLLRGHCLAQDAQNHNDAGERGRHHEKRGRKGQHRHDKDDHHRGRNLFRAREISRYAD